MLVGPLAEAAAQADGRMHVFLPDFVEPAPFLFVLTYIYTGALGTDVAVACGIALEPPTFDAAQFVCAVLQLADHFMLAHLKQWCETYLGQPALLTVHSIVDLL